MKIALGCDHRGFAAKQELLPHLKTLGFQTEDFGCDNILGVDYPDIAYPVAVAVASHECDLGVLIDCNGIGITMVANKVPGVRAATGCDEFTARCARENYHCNVIDIGAKSRDHAHPRHHFWKHAHRDWRVQVAVVLMLVAILVYVVTVSLSLRPGKRAIQPTPEISAP